MEEFLDLGGGEGVWEFAPAGGLVEEVGRVGLCAPLGVKPAAEDLYGGEVARDGGCFERTIAAQGGDVGGQGGRGDVGGGGDACCGEGGEEIAEVSAVSLDCGGG